MVAGLLGASRAFGHGVLLGQRAWGNKKRLAAERETFNGSGWRHWGQMRGGGNDKAATRDNELDERYRQTPGMSPTLVGRSCYTAMTGA